MGSGRLDVVAVDPGLTTGWVSGWVENGEFELVESGEVRNCISRDNGGEGPIHPEMVKLMDRIWYSSVLVIEDFVVYQNAIARGGVGSTDVDGLSPVSVMWAIVSYLQAHDWFVQGGVMVRQMASSAKGFATDARLVGWGYAVPGRGHAKDALRHALLYSKAVQNKVL